MTTELGAAVGMLTSLGACTEKCTVHSEPSRTMTPEPAVVTVRNIVLSRSKLTSSDACDPILRRGRPRHRRLHLW